MPGVHSVSLSTTDGDGGAFGSNCDGDCDGDEGGKCHGVGDDHCVKKVMVYVPGGGHDDDVDDDDDEDNV